MSWFSPVLGYTAAAALLAGALGGWTVRDWRADAAEAKAALEATALREKNHKLQLEWSTRYEELRSQLSEQQAATRRMIREAYRDVEVPSQCAAPDDVVRMLGEARDRANTSATGKPVRTVPTPPASPPPVGRP